MNISLSTQEIERLGQRFREMPQLVYQELVNGFTRLGQRIVATMRTEPFSGSDPLHVRSGALRRGFDSSAQQSGNTVIMTVSNDTPYARLQEYGGTVVPKTARALAIPLAAALTGAGVPKFPGGPRTVPDLVMIQRKGRNPLLVQINLSGKGKTRVTSMTPMFVLVPSVYVPPRLGFRWWFNKLTSGEQNSPLQLEIRAAIRRIWQRGQQA